MSGYWPCRVRTPGLALTDPVQFSSATLVENYNRPDMLLLTGSLDALQPAARPGYGVVLSDPSGVRRFSGFTSDIEATGDNSQFNLSFSGDLARLWGRECWPTPAGDWKTGTGGQTTAYDDQTAPAETKLLHYIEVNAGSSAYNAGGVDRRVPHLRLPTTAGRGPSNLSHIRFDWLGKLIVSMAELAGLRIAVQQTYTGLTPYLDVVLTAAPDLSASVRFGTARSAPLKVGKGWRYKISIPTVTTVLAAATGVGTARILKSQTDATAETLWGQRIESTLSLTNESDTGAITDAMTTALADGAGPSEVSVPLPATPLVDNLAVGTKVTAKLGAETFVERIRQRTTTIGAGGATVQITAVLGDATAGLQTPTARRLAALSRRIDDLEGN